MQRAAGWGIIIGAGLVFSLITSAVVWVDYNFGGTYATSEEFNTAGRSVKTGLTAAVIVSQWTWAATLLQSSNVAWKFGVSGPFWYAAGASIQVLLFGILALQVKLKAPRAHTSMLLVPGVMYCCVHACTPACLRECCVCPAVLGVCVRTLLARRHSCSLVHAVLALPHAAQQRSASPLTQAAHVCIASRVRSLWHGSDITDGVAHSCVPR